MTDENRAAYSRLRRLQEHTLSDLPAQIAQRAMSSFTLHDEPLPEESTADVRVVVYPQDPFVSEPEVRIMAARDIKPGLINARVRIRDSAGEPAQPDENGNYFFWAGTREFDQINAFYYATFTLRMYERYARRELPWSFPAARIDVDPHIGNGANAFYSEQDRLLGFLTLHHNSETFVTAQSADIVSHETAHAVLDGLRDLYNESFGLGGMSFHESFGDMTAVLVALHDDSLISRLLDWTKGDLRLNNFIAAVAENIGKATKVNAQLEEHVQEHTYYLRNSINDFKNEAFEKLPYRAKNYELELARESHNYSRLFTGAFYDILVGMYEKLRAEMPPRIAIHRGRDHMGQLLVAAIEAAPVGEFTFEDMAKAFLAASSVGTNGDYLDILIKVFADRRILSTREANKFVKSLAKLPDLRLPKSINSALASARFLEEQVAPKLRIPNNANLTPLSAYRNAAGTAYLTYFSHQRIVLKGRQYKQFDGSHVDSFGGLTLMFDPKGKLRSAFYRPVTNEDGKQISALTAELIAHGLIAHSLTGEGEEGAALYMVETSPKGLWVPEIPDDLPLEQLPTSLPPNKLVKFPVNFDAIPRNISHIRQYLESMKKRVKPES
jgi:hypothetical protein